MNHAEPAHSHPAHGSRRPWAWTGRALVIAIPAFCAPALARAQQQERPTTAEEQAACTPDALSLCSAYIPDGDRVRGCLMARIPQLSPACRKVIEARRK